MGTLEVGCEVIVPVDAIGSRSERTETAAIRQMENAGASVTSVRSLLMRQTPEVSTLPGSAILRSLGALQEDL
jgi:hypothetical protein